MRAQNPALLPIHTTRRSIPERSRPQLLNGWGDRVDVEHIDHDSSQRQARLVEYSADHLSGANRQVQLDGSIDQPLQVIA